MLQISPTDPTESEQDFAAARPLRPLTLAGLLTLIAYSGGVAAVSFVTFGHVPALRHAIWTVAAALFLVAWAVLVLVMWMRKPGVRETVQVWGQASNFITYSSQVIVAWAIWWFFGVCPEAERLMMAGMFLLCSPAQLIAAPENVSANRFGILASNGSLVLWFALHGSANGLALAGFALGIGVMLFILCGYLPGTVSEAVKARYAAEQAKVELQLALAAVAAERDAKTQFIAAASHDLGQPLQAASLFFDQTLRAPGPAQRDRAADGVRKAFASADQLISHMLNHLRLEADAVDPFFARVSVGSVLARIAAQFEPAAKAAGISIRVVETRSSLWTDRVLLERALGNLINNAVQHSGASRIVMGVRPFGPDRRRLWVVDDGRGIADADADHLFEDYYRGSAPVVKSGFGLGLSSVRRIAILLRGEARFETRWKGGAAFYLEFPAQAPAKGRRS